MMHSQHPLPVEPLSEQAWERIREEVFAELDAGEPEVSPRASAAPRASKWRLAAGMLAACAVLVLGLVLALRSAATDARGISSSLIATTGTLTRATIGDATVEVAVNSVLRVTGSEESGFNVLLEHGRASFAVPKREGRPAFRVQAGEATVEVVGTKFAVSHLAGRARVTVERGSVRVTFRGETTLLEPGQAWNQPQELADSREAEVKSERLEPLPSAGAEKKGESDPPSPKSSAAAKPKAASRPAKTRAVQDSRKRAEAQTTQKTDAAKVESHPSARERYAIASGLEARDPNRALAIYLELSQEHSGWAANALYAAGRLQLERGRRAHARQLLQQYLTRFPAGPNAAEARLLLRRSE